LSGRFPKIVPIDMPSMASTKTTALARNTSTVTTSGRLFHELLERGRHLFDEAGVAMDDEQHRQLVLAREIISGFRPQDH